MAFSVLSAVLLITALSPGAPPARDARADGAQRGVTTAIGRRALLGVLPTILTVRAAHALEIPGVLSIEMPSVTMPSFGNGFARPKVEIVSSTDVCAGRCRDQDFVVVRYVGKRGDGTVFDDRYAQQPLVYELGSFYLPGVDEALEGACAGSTFRFSWVSSPSLGTPEMDAKLAPGTPIEMELELLSIRYSLFGEKMRNATNAYWFAPSPLSLTSPFDPRGHLTDRTPEIRKDNPFSIAPGEKNLISNIRGFF
jgi:hypothetical protein